MLTSIKFAIEREGKEVLSFSMDNTGLNLTETMNMPLQRGLLIQQEEPRTLKRGDKITITTTEFAE